MAQIKVNTGGIASLEGTAKKASSQCSSCIAVMSNIRSGLDWNIRAESEIGERITAIDKRLKRQKEKINAYNTVLKNVSQEFSRTDKALKQEMKELQYRVTKTCPVGPYKKKSSLLDSIFNFKNKWYSMALGILEDLDDFDIDVATTGGIAAGIFNAVKGGVAFMKERYGEGTKYFSKSIKSLVTAKEILKTGGKLVGKAARKITAVGCVLDVIGNIGSNYQEYKDGEIPADRARLEFIQETIIDVGIPLAISAICPAAGITYGICKSLADLGCELRTGEDLTELISDALIDKCGGIQNLIYIV